jgi:hypothetical protein
MGAESMAQLNILLGKNHLKLQMEWTQGTSAEVSLIVSLCLIHYSTYLISLTRSQSQCFKSNERSIEQYHLVHNLHHRWCVGGHRDPRGHSPLYLQQAT